MKGSTIEGFQCTLINSFYNDFNQYPTKGYVQVTLMKGSAKLHMMETCKLYVLLSQA